MAKYKIGGSEIGAVLGLSKWVTPMDLYMRKLGLVDQPIETEPMSWGIASEHVVARRYQKETGYKLFPATDEGYDYKNPLVHPEYDWWTVTPDRKIITPEDEGLLEIKVIGERAGANFGDPPDGDVPEEYLCQCAWGMAVLNVEWAHLAVQTSNRSFRIYRINRDRELENQLRDAALAFINDHLITQVPPPLDGSESSRRWLNYRYPEDRGPILEPTDEDILGDIDFLRIAKKHINEWEAQEAFLENRIKALIGDAQGLQGEWGKITWRKTKESMKTDWLQAFNQLANFTSVDKAVEMQIVNQATTIRPGSRRFLAKFKGD